MTDCNEPSTVLTIRAAAKILGKKPKELLELARAEEMPQRLELLKWVDYRFLCLRRDDSGEVLETFDPVRDGRTGHYVALLRDALKDFKDEGTITTEEFSIPQSISHSSEFKRFLTCLAFENPETPSRITTTHTYLIGLKGKFLNDIYVAEDKILSIKLDEESQIANQVQPAESGQETDRGFAQTIINQQAIIIQATNQHNIRTTFQNIDNSVSVNAPTTIFNLETVIPADANQTIKQETPKGQNQQKFPSNREVGYIGRKDCVTAFAVRGVKRSWKQITNYRKNGLKIYDIPHPLPNGQLTKPYLRDSDITDFLFEMKKNKK